MSVCCECCVLSGRGLCDELITRTDESYGCLSVVECCVLSGRGLCDELTTPTAESYRLWCVVVCDLETSLMRRSWPTGGCRAKNKKKKILQVLIANAYENEVLGYDRVTSFDKSSMAHSRNTV
jgi:hypothetical protein